MNNHMQTEHVQTNTLHLFISNWPVYQT